MIVTVFGNQRPIDEKTIMHFFVSNLLLAFVIAGLHADAAYGANPTVLRIDSVPVTGQSAAVVVDDCQLIHTRQLLPVGRDGKVVSATFEEQVDHVLKHLDELIAASRTSRDRIVKLNIYVADAVSRDIVRQKLTGWFDHDSLPAVSWVATALPLAGAKVALDAVIADDRKSDAALPKFGNVLAGPVADWCEMPRGDVVYVSGQAEPGELAEATRATLDSLLRTIRHMQLDRQHIVSLKCFLQPMSQVEVVNLEIKRFFGEATVPPVSHVEWISGSRPIEIELIAFAPGTKTTAQTVSFSAPPWMKTSPVYSRVARIHGDTRIYVSGLYSATDGDGNAQVRSIFGSLESILTRAGSDIRHLAKATYYVSDDECSKQLNAIRPSIYDPKRPPAASKAMVNSVAADRRGITIDMIAGPVAKGLTSSATDGQWFSGTAVAVITPRRPMMLAGFGSRKRPADGTASELHAKALAIKDVDGARLVVVCCDLISIPRPLRERVEKRVSQKFQLPPASLLLNASHTHCGPELKMTLTALEELSSERKNLTIEYCQRLEDTLVELIGQALENIEPSQLQYSHSRCGFAMNRRLKNSDPNGEPYLNHPNPDGPVDHDVPVLSVVNNEGELQTVLFGYACHNTTMWENQFAGDYAGYAQQFLEQDHPGAVAMFLTGCGGDQCGYPRGTMEHARRHGRTLATAVDAALGNRQRSIRGRLVTQFDRVDIDYASPPTREQLEAVAAGEPNKLFKDYELNSTHAKRLLRQLDREGDLRTSYDYPVQTVRFGNDLVLIALAGEVVVDYSLRLKRELSGSAPVWVAGYCNDVFAYIPSRRVLNEGGYEPRRSMNWMTTVVQPGPFAPSVEARIIGKVHELLRHVPLKTDSTK